MSEYPPYEGAAEHAPYPSTTQAQAVLALLLLVLVFVFIRTSATPELPPLQPRIIAAPPTLGLPPIPTLMPTLPPQVIYVERPAEAAPRVVEDNSVHVCIGFCPGGSR